ncbi:hypothetical protein [Membranihabitans maritimus]|uniref:hypothetical protein n=1 Tax=Membranihabitans maritimus TaxID=2904244 RepID=UPI001F26003A|nr:hypothetical protein [Membranihabitans maritimus]
MVKRLRDISFLIVGLIILVHNITPHLHHDEISEEQHLKAHYEANNVLDWILLSFHNNLENGHLECYSEIENINLSPNLDFIIPVDFMFDFNYVSIIRPDSTKEISRSDLYHFPDIFRHFYHSLAISNRPPPSNFG